MMIDPEKKNQIYHGGTGRTEFYTEDSTIISLGKVSAHSVSW